MALLAVAASSDEMGEEGITFALSLFTTFFPPRWFHNGRKVSPAAVGHNIMSSGSILLFNVTNAEHEGQWRCRVENQLGSEEVTLHLMIYGGDQREVDKAKPNSQTIFSLQLL